MGWKYVMVENKIGDTKFLFPVIFPDKLVHLQVANAVHRIMPGYHSNGCRVVSAGKIEHIEVLGLGGASETLGIGSKPREDTATIESCSYTHGVI